MAGNDFQFSRVCYVSADQGRPLDRWGRNHEPIASDKPNNHFQSTLDQPSTSGLNLNVRNVNFCDEYSSSDDEEIETSANRENIGEHSYCYDNSSSEDEDTETSENGKNVGEHKYGGEYDDGAENESVESATEELSVKYLSKLDLFVDRNHLTVSDYSSEGEDTGSEAKFVDETSNCESDEATVFANRTSMMHELISMSDKHMLSLNTLEKELHRELAKIADKRQALNTVKLMPKGNYVGKKSHWSNHAPFFTDLLDNSSRPPNADYLKMKANNELIMRDQPPFTNWTRRDKARLKLGVAELTKRKTRPLAEAGEEADASNVEFDDNDWDMIAACVEDRHSAVECRGIWVNHLLPTIKCKRPYTKREGMRLEQIAECYGHQDWDAIASDLGNNRSALQCFVLYTCNLERRRGFVWSKDEDERLVHLVKQHRVGDRIDWASVSFGLPGRDLKQVAAHWTYVANPKIKKGRFTSEEDQQLFKGIRLFGTDFTKIVKYFLPQRTRPQVRSHYLQFNSTTYMGRWTREEDKALLHLAKKYNEKKWAIVSKHFIAPARSARQVRTRYLTLRRWITQNIVARQRHSRQLQFWAKRHEKLHDLTDYVKEKMDFRTRRCRNSKSKLPMTQVDLDLEEFLRVNFIEGRTERCPGSLQRSFTLAEEEVEERATSTNQLLEILGAKLNISERVMMEDVSVSNRDKLVFARIKEQNAAKLELNQRLESTSNSKEVFHSAFVSLNSESLDQETPRRESVSLPVDTMSSPKRTSSSAEDIGLSSGIDVECSLAQPSTSHQCEGSSAGTSTTAEPVSPADFVADNAHSDFLLPHLGTLVGLSNIVLDRYQNRTLPNALCGRDSDLNDESKAAAHLWMERLKTVFLYPILLPPEIVEAKLLKAEAEIAKRKEEEEEEKRQRASVKVFGGKKTGRPPKRRWKKKNIDEAAPPPPPPPAPAPPAPKRPYRKTGKYSMKYNITPRDSCPRKLDKKD